MHQLTSLFILSFSLSLLEPSQEAWGRAFLGHSPLSSGVCLGTCRHWQDQDSGQDPTYSRAGWGGRGDHTADWSDLCPRGGHPRTDQDGEGGGLKGWVSFSRLLEARRITGSNRDRQLPPALGMRTWLHFPSDWNVNYSFSSTAQQVFTFCFQC